MYESAQNLAHELRLFGIHGSLERRCSEALAESLHPSELVRLLLEDEKDRRREMLAKRLATRARFRNQVVLADWDDSEPRGLTKAKIKELGLLNFYHKKQNLIIVGKTGLGKTHLSIALGNQLCLEGHSTYFMSVNLLFEEAAAAKASGKYLQMIKKLKKMSAIILDDFALRKYSHEEANILVEVLEERYQNGVTVVTSQVSPEGWQHVFEDSVISEAICDRLINPSEIILLKGSSYRKKLKNVESP